MLSEEKVKRLLVNVRQTKSNAKCSGTDESYGVSCKAEKLLKKILEIKE